ncbi:MAG TPA: transglycosylase domain-containing protein [Thermomicrobiales bacterium]|jgi:membrane peptidoglycan carboxypeptidase
MSNGRIARANRRYPTARRRSARYGQAQLARRAVGLPPHLMPGVSGRDEKRGLGYAKFVIAGGVLTLIALIVGGAMFVASTAAAVGGTVDQYKKVNRSLQPSAAQVAAETFETTRIFDRNGVLLQEVEPEGVGGYRTFVDFDEISPYLIEATVAAEDATFWSHYGVEPMAIARGALINASGTGSSGGSTITQQLARGLYPNQIDPNDRSYTRKFKEALAAIQLDRKYSKQDLITMYLNQIFYGQRSYGIEAASETFFNKKASELNLAEASLLAGLPQAPSYYDPTVNFDVAKRRQQYVLDQMVKYGYVTPQEAKNAKNVALHPSDRNSSIRHAPHFTIYVEDYLKQKYGEDAFFKGGLQVTTSIDVNLQETAEQILQRDLNEYGIPYGRNNASMIVMQPWSGQILAMVGSAGFNDTLIGGQNNYTTAPLQPGSSIKPVVYAAAFESGWNPGTVILDTTMKRPDPSQPNGFYEPQNYTGISYGAVPVRIALANSLNIPALKTIEFAGIAHVQDLGHRMGYTKSLYGDPATYGIPLALGSGEVTVLEHTNVFATFANNGRYVPANPILKITDARGNVLYDAAKDLKANPGQQALRAEYAYQITSILTDNQARSMIFTENNLFGDTAQQLGRPTAAKSGTTNGWKDIWTMGYTTDLAIGVWMGQTTATGDRYQELPERDGIQGAGPIWADLMLEMHQNPKWASLLKGPNGQTIPEDFPVPSGLHKGRVCDATGHQATGGSASHEEWLVDGRGPSLRCDQVSAAEYAELQYALNDLNQNGGKYSGNGQSSIYRYASAVGVSRGSFSGGGFSGGDFSSDDSSGGDYSGFDSSSNDATIDDSSSGDAAPADSSGNDSSGNEVPRIIPRGGG